MSRLSVFLEKMGAEIKLTNNDFLPLQINGNINLIPMEHIMQKPSAQVKSAIILSALNMKGKTKIIEKRNTRDHTERLMKYKIQKENIKQKFNLNRT